MERVGLTGLGQFYPYVMDRKSGCVGGEIVRLASEVGPSHEERSVGTLN